MSFLMKDHKLLEKYNEIWEKVRNTIFKKMIMNFHTMKNIKNIK